MRCWREASASPCAKAWTDRPRAAVARRAWSLFMVVPCESLPARQRCRPTASGVPALPEQRGLEMHPDQRAAVDFRCRRADGTLGQPIVRRQAGNDMPAAVQDDLLRHLAADAVP